MDTKSSKCVHLVEGGTNGSQYVNMAPMGKTSLGRVIHARKSQKTSFTNFETHGDGSGYLTLFQWCSQRDSSGGNCSHWEYSSREQHWVSNAYQGYLPAIFVVGHLVRSCTWAGRADGLGMVGTCVLQRCAGLLLDLASPSAAKMYYVRTIFLCLWLSGPPRVPHVPRVEVLALGVLGLPNPFPGLFLCTFGGFRVRATVGPWLSRYARPRCPPSPPPPPWCLARVAPVARVAHVLVFWLSGCPWGRLLVGRVLRVLQSFLLGTGSGKTEGGWLPRDLRAIGKPCRDR